MKVKALITAAGVGKRLGALTTSKNKALLHVEKKALITHIVEKLRAKGIRSIQPLHQLNNRFAGVGPFHRIFQIFQHLADNVVTDNVNVDFEYCAGFQTFLQQLILSGGEILATPCFGFACKQYVVNTNTFVGPCLPCDASQGIINTYGLTQDGERLIFRDLEDDAEFAAGIRRALNA